MDIQVPRAYREAASASPSGVLPGQVVADVDAPEVVVFLIGMRFNRWRRVGSWRPVLTGMPRMLAELASRPDSGLLGARTYWSGRVVLVVQYWRSVEDLGRFARDPAMTHSPVWSAFNRTTAGSGDVGIFHETYAVPREAVESIYGNMPAFGLARAVGHRPRGAGRRTAATERMGKQDPGYPPVVAAAGLSTSCGPA